MAAAQRPKIGLVLGGGGAKGASEVGVLKYIEQSGVPIDYIVGTSIGSIVGGLYSTGSTAEELDSMFRSQKWNSLLTSRTDSLSHRLFYKRDGVRYWFGFPLRKKHVKGTPHKRGVLSGDSIVEFLDRMSGYRDSIAFDDLPIPFRCVAVEAHQFKEVVFDRGVLSHCMRASMSIPIAFNPVRRDSMMLVDGGMINNLPVDVCRAMGADIIIAVDLTQNKHEGDKLVEVSQRKMKRLLRAPRLVKLIAWSKERPDLLRYHENLKNVDIYINPDLKGCSAASFVPKKIERMIEAGEEAGREALPQLKALAELCRQREGNK